MAFRAVHSWTLVGLIEGFVELALVYFLLCGSVFAFFVSKFLNIFGLFLPCPCRGLFGYQNSDLCLHKLLSDWPIKTIYSLQRLAKSRLPYNLIWFTDQAGNCNLNVELISDGKCDSRVLELENEACSSSISGPRLQNSVDKESGNDAKEKKIMNQKQRSRIRRRRRSALGYGHSSSYLLSGDMQSLVAGVSSSPFNGSGIRSEISESLGPVSRFEDGLQDDGVASNDIDLDEKTWHSFELSGSFEERKGMAEDTTSVEKFISSGQIKPEIVGNEANVIRMLEQALEEEKAARAALYLELEKERAAAASAADEAMAMILRLQEDKASIEMEARQYHRMIDEKFSYDEEEMNILKEILVRKERENHFLEKEVEAYRQMSFLGNEKSEGGVNYMINKGGQGPSLSLDSNEDPLLVLPEIENSKSIGKKEAREIANWSSNYEAPSVGKQSHTLALEKEITSQNKDLGSDLSTSQGQGQMLEKGYQFSHQGHGLLEKTIVLGVKEMAQKDVSMVWKGMETEAGQTCGILKYCSCGGEELEKDKEFGNEIVSNLHGSLLEIEPTVYDVHVIDDTTELRNEESGPLNCAASDCGVWNAGVLNNSPRMRMALTEHDIHRSSMDMSNRLPVLGSSQHETLLFDSRRSSSPAVSSERLKIDTEVEWLRERLRVVQEEKEKLTFSAEHRERVDVQLKLVEEIVNQLREIQQLRDSARQASLPPSSSKASLKKRHCRSVSWEAHESA